jgi:hypothetical protein
VFAGLKCAEVFSEQKKEDVERLMKEFKARNVGKIKILEETAVTQNLTKDGWIATITYEKV